MSAPINKMTERTENRSMRLFDIGLQWNGSEFTRGDINLHWTELTADTDDEFEQKFTRIENEIKRRETQFA